MALAFKGSIAKESARVNNNHYDLRRTVEIMISFDTVTCSG
jgi:hypothetical protein